MAYLGFNVIRVPRSSGNVLKDRISRNLHIGYSFEDEAFEAIQKVSGYTMLPYEPLVTLYSQVVYCEQNKIPGCFVECGTWKGGATGLMALANLRFGTERRELHLFDAFEEICQPDELFDEQDLVQEVKKIAKKKHFESTLQPLKGIYDSFGGPGSLAENRDLLENKIRYPANHIHYHIGWFQDTVPADAPRLEPIAILRLDGDWYQSTKVCLENLYNRVVMNGIVIVDDYGYNTGCKKAVDDFLTAQGAYPIMNFVNHTCRYFIKLK
jgi:hypothetical protein